MTSGMSGIAIAVSFAAGAIGCERTAAEKPTPAVPIPTDVALPVSSATQEPDPGALLLVLSPTVLALWPERKMIAVPPADAKLQGFAVGDKRVSRADYLVVPLHDALAARFGPDAARPEVLLAVDVSTPYRLFIEVFYTVGQSHPARVSLLVRSGAGQAVIDVVPQLSSARGGLCRTEEDKRGREAVAAILGAAAGTPIPTTEPSEAVPLPSNAPLCFSVVAAEKGFVVSAFGHELAPGCSAAAPRFAVAVPKRDGAFDFAQLSACAARMKERASETDAVVYAKSGTDFQTVVSTMDAIRGKADGGSLFPSAAFGPSP